MSVRKFSSGRLKPTNPVLWTCNVSASFSRNRPTSGPLIYCVMETVFDWYKVGSWLTGSQRVSMTYTLLKTVSGANQSPWLSNTGIRKQKKNEPVATGVEMDCAVILWNMYLFSSLVSWYTTAKILESSKWCLCTLMTDGPAASSKLQDGD